jgi:hypothetical protein
MNSLEKNNKIGKYIKTGFIKLSPQDKDEILSIVSEDKDSSDYFFSKIGKDWLSFCRKKKLFEHVKNNDSRFEERYLLNMLEVDPKETYKIISKFNFTGEYRGFFDRLLSVISYGNEKTYRVDRDIFIKILDLLLVNNILLKTGNSFSITETYKRLFSEGIIEKAIDFSEVIFTAEDTSGFIPKFYFDTSYNDHLKDILKIVEEKDISPEDSQKFIFFLKNKLYEVLNWREKKSEKDFGDSFYIIGDDVGDIDISDGFSWGVQKFLAALLFIFYSKEVQRLKLTKNYQSDFLQLFKYEKQFRLLNRFKFHFYLLDFETLSNEIKKDLNHDDVFINYSDEYIKVLKKAFDDGLIGKTEWKEYIKSYIENHKDKLSLVWGVSSAIHNYLSPTQISDIERMYADEYSSGEVIPLLPIDPNKPKEKEPQFGRQIGVHSKFTYEFLSEKEVADIIKTIDVNISPKTIESESVRGTSNVLESVILDKQEEFTNNLNKFLDMDYKRNIPNWVSSYFRAIYKLPEEEFKNINLVAILEFIIELTSRDSIFIKQKRDETKESFYEGILLNWEAVFMDAQRFLEKIIKEYDSDTLSNEKIKNKLFIVIKKFSQFDDQEYNDPVRGYTHGKDDMRIVDFYSNAINSVQGVSFELLFYYIFKTNDKDNIEDNAKKLIEDYFKIDQKVMKKGTYCMIAKYMPNMFFRDREWSLGVMEQLYNKENGKFLVAAVVGQTLGTVYTKFFDEMKSRYLFILENYDNLSSSFIDDGKIYKINYFNNKDHDGDFAMITHIAIAYFYNMIDGEDKLFKFIFEQGSIPMRQKFINSITSQVSRDKKDLEKNEISLKIREFSNKTNDPELDTLNLFMNPSILGILDQEESIEISVDLSKQFSGQIRYSRNLFAYLDYFTTDHSSNVLLILNNIYASFGKEGFYDVKPLKLLLKKLSENEENIDHIKEFINKLLSLDNKSIFWEFSEVLE